MKMKSTVLVVLIGCLLSFALAKEEVDFSDDNNNNKPIRAVKRQTTTAAVVSEITRTTFPNFGDEPVAGSNPFIGFTHPSGTLLQQTTQSNVAFMYWSNSSNTIQNCVTCGCTFAQLGEFNSFCDIPIPDTATFSGLPEATINPQPNEAYTFSCPGVNEAPMFLTIWISEESFIQGGLLVFTYQYFYSPSSGRFRSVFQAPACYPTVNKISPGFAYTIGSVLFIEGERFGVNAEDISVMIGTNKCDDVEIVVSDSLIRCIAAGSGSALRVNVTVGSKSTQAPFQLLSFSDACPLICNAGSYPDRDCKSCIRPQSSTDDIGTSRLSQVVSSISSDLVEATFYSDVTFLKTAELYKNNAIMEVLSIPRYTVPDVTVDMKFAIAATTPLKVTALTNLLQGYDADVIPSLELHYESQQAQWTKIDNNGTTEYRLDII